MNSSKNSQNLNNRYEVQRVPAIPSNIKSYNSAIHSKKQSGVSSQKTGPGIGYRDNSGFANEMLDQTHTPNSKMQSFK